MLKLIKCEFLKLKRKPLVFISVFLSALLPLAYAIFLADANTDVDATNNMMSGLFQLSAYLLLMPLLVILASNLLFEELDNDTLKNLVTIPVNRTKLVLSKMLVLLLFAIGFMAVGALVILAALLIQGWNPVGFWKLFQVGIGEGVIMWVGALPCILIVVLLDKNYIVSVVITFFYSLDFGTPAQQSTGFHIAPTDRVQAPPAPPKGSDTGAVSVIPILINST